MLRPAASAVLSSRQPDVTHRLELTGGMARYNWGINGMSLDMADPGALRFLMRQGQRVRVVFANTTAMYHPMHVHGHTFALSGTGTRKDTVIVLPAGSSLRLRRRTTPASGWPTATTSTTQPNRA